MPTQCCNPGRIIPSFLLASLLMISPIGCKGTAKSLGSDAAGKLVTASENLVKASDTLALSVPGEYWSRLVRMMGDPDDNVRKRAQEQVARIFQINPEVQYRATAVFGFDEAKGPLLADAFLASFADKLEVESRCVEGVEHPLQEVRNATTVPRTRELAADEIRKQIGDALDRLSNPWGKEVAPRREGALIPRLPESGGIFAQPDTALNAQMNAAAKQARDEATELLYQAFVSAYQGVPLPLGERDVTKVYSPVEGKNVMVILVDEAALVSHRDSFSVTISIHDAAKPTVLFPGRRPLTLRADQFPAEYTLPCGVPRRPVRYAIVPLNDDRVASKELLAVMAEIETLVKQIGKAAVTEADGRN